MLTGSLADMGGQFTALSAGATSSFSAAMAQIAAASKGAAASVLYDWAGHPIKRIGDQVASEVESAAARTVSSTRGAREAIRGLGEEIGVHMPRFVGSWLASLGPVSGIMGAAFAPIAAIGLIEIIGKLPETIQRGVDALHGWTAEAKKAFEHATEYASKYEHDQIELFQRLRAIQLIGKEGADEYNVALTINSQNIDQIAAKIDELHVREKELVKIINWQPPKELRHTG